MVNLKKLINENKKKIVLIVLAIILILITAYQLKLLGLAIDETSDVVSASEESLESEKEIVTNVISEDISDVAEDTEILEGVSKENVEEEIIESDSIVENEEKIIEEIKEEEITNTVSNEISNEVINEVISNQNVATNEIVEEVVEETIPTELTFENEEYKVVVTANAENVLKDIKEVRVNQITAENQVVEYSNISNKLDEELDEDKELVGFMAYDISLVNKDGIEVEPDGNVTISFEYKNIPEKVQNLAEAEEVSVVHLEENELTGELNAVEYSTENNNLNLEFTSENEVKKFDLNTDSFSTYVIFWKNDRKDTKFTITLHYVDTNGDDIKNEQYTTSESITSSSLDLKQYASQISNYELSKIYVKDNGSKVEVDNITFSKQNGMNGGGDYIASFNGGNVTYTVKGPDSKSIDVYIEYKAVSKGLSITDTITQDGNINAVVDGEKETDLENVSYTWYKLVNGTYVKVERIKVTGDLYNISEDGTSLNVALDNGSQATYKVVREVLNPLDESVESSLESTYTVPYYDALQNGSFETPYVGRDIGSSYQPFIDGGTNGIVWKTTASDNKIEIVNTDNNYDGTSTHKALAAAWHGVDDASDGNQYAELNANTESALYQDVLTIPGSTMYWSLDHNGRSKSNVQAGKSDTMYVVISSTSAANNVSQTDLNAIIAKTTLTSRGNSQTITYNGYEYTVYKITDTVDTSWHNANGSYVVPDGQYLTRYYFVSGETATSDKSVGNHIDNVWFSTEIPKPNGDKISLQLTKTITGLTETDFNTIKGNIKFILTSNNSDLNGKEISGSEITWKALGDKTYSGTYAIVNQEISANSSVDITVKETNADNSSFTLVTSSSINDGTLVERQSEVTGKNVTSGNVIKFNFENDYSVISNSFSFMKYGYDLDSNKAETLGGAEFTLTSTSGETYIISSSNDSSNKGLVTFNDIPYGNYTLKESNAPAGYILDSDTEYTVEVGKEVKINGKSVSSASDFVVYNLTNTTTVSIVKKDYKDLSLGLKNAEFELINLSDQTKNLSGITDENGKLTLENVIYGQTYKLVETNAPSGYYTLVDDVYVTVSRGENSNLVITLSNNSSKDNSNFVSQYVNLDNNNVINVTDIAMTVLPKAGGIGVYWFYVLGMVMMCSVTIIYKKINKED